MKKTHKLAKKSILLLSILVCIILLSAIYYYQYYPRYTLGYGNTRISKRTWEVAYPGFPDYAASLYYKRFENEYNYKAYLLYAYDGYIIFMNKGDVDSPCIIGRIMCADINKNDKKTIEKMYHKYREMFLNQIDNYHPSVQEGREYICRALVADYFMYYYNHEQHHFHMDMKEFSVIFNWLKQNDSNIEEHLNDPFNWRNCDFSELADSRRLRNWISMNISSDFILDMEYYDEWIRRFRLFYNTITETHQR